MAFLGEALLSASLEVLIDRLASREVLNFFHGKKSDQEELLDRLKTTVYDAGAVLDAAEYEHFGNRAVKSWLDDLRDAIYHANDLLDQFSTEAATQKGVSSFSCLLNSHDGGMRNKMEEITFRLESLVKLKDNLGLEKKARGNLPWRAQSLLKGPTTSLPEGDVYGRKEAKDYVIKTLLGDKDDDSILSVIPIVGMGGIGKTTLAREVYNDGMVEEKFSLKAWVCVSEEFDILKITMSILKAVSPSSCDMGDLDSLQVKLKEILSMKKFLIILDDVWNENYNEWVRLRKPFLHGVKGSKILLTTRSEKVALTMGNTDIYHVDKLSDKDSWLLFAKHAFHSMDGDGAIRLRLEKIGGDIVKKCKGLPLAIIALAGLLRSNYDVEYWEIILKSNLWDLPEECEILPSLGISYLYLSPHLKQCFVYCSLFPKDYEFDKKELIRLWMAEGFLQSSNKEIRMEEVGHVHFEELVSRSFFQRLTNHEGHFVMHDLMHDLSIFCAGEFYHRLGTGGAIDIPKRTRHLSYEAKNVTSEDIKALCDVEAESLRSIVVQCDPFSQINYEMKAEHVDRLLSKFKLLRVLFIVGCEDEELPNSIGQLIFLRYLDLSFSEFKKLPASLYNLFNLQTLKLERGITLPKGINKLENLRYLSLFVVSKDEGANIEELGRLANISTFIRVVCIENVKSSKEAIEAEMMDKMFIEELHLEWSPDDDVMNDSETERDILDKLQPHLNLKVLNICGYRGTRFPDWSGQPSYQNMVDITLMGCYNCCILPPLGQLPFLKRLSIMRFKKLVNVGAEFYKTSDSPFRTSFPSLEFLRINHMDVLTEWSSTEIEAFPKLQLVAFFGCRELLRCCISAKQMEFCGCPKLEFSRQQPYHSLESLMLYGRCESLSSFPADTFPNLEVLDIVESTKLEDGCWLKDGLLPPSLSSLTLRSLTDLETFNLEAFRCLTSLQQLRIIRCRKLKRSEVERLAPLVTQITIDDCGISDEEVRHLSNVNLLEKFP